MAITVDDIIKGNYVNYLHYPLVSKHSFVSDIRQLALDPDGDMIDMLDDKLNLKTSLRGDIYLNHWSEDDWDKYDKFLKSKGITPYDPKKDFDGETLNVFELPVGSYSIYEYGLIGELDKEYVNRVLSTIRTLTTIKQVYLAKSQSKYYETYLEEVREFIKTDDYKRLPFKGKQVFTQKILKNLQPIVIKSLGLEGIDFIDEAVRITGYVTPHINEIGDLAKPVLKKLKLKKD